jgi:hypothetical protein
MGEAGQDARPLSVSGQRLKILLNPRLQIFEELACPYCRFAKYGAIERESIAVHNYMSQPAKSGDFVIEFSVQEHWHIGSGRARFPELPDQVDVPIRP